VPQRRRPDGAGAHPGGVASCGVGGALSGWQYQRRNTLAPEQPPNFVTLGWHRTARSGAGHRGSYHRLSRRRWVRTRTTIIWYDSTTNFPVNLPSTPADQGAQRRTVTNADQATESSALRIARRVRSAYARVR
jgi:hypothetical protein